MLLASFLLMDCHRCSAETMLRVLHASRNDSDLTITMIIAHAPALLTLKTSTVPPALHKTSP